ncbi:MAG: DUF2007 domain-containing protein [Bacteroidales bacterium]|nr:DUF2007 domain-containing protein [Bacteroidales bacterium]
MKDNPDFVKVYAINKLYLIEMLKAYLADHQVESFILNQQDSSYHFGDIELYVRKENEEKSEKLIKKFEENE